MRSKTGVQLIGQSPAMLALQQEVDRVARSDAKVLITGESGTGKELIARSIHQQGNRKDKPFVAINCAAIPENMLEEANEARHNMVERIAETDDELTMKFLEGESLELRLKRADKRPIPETLRIGREIAESGNVTIRYATESEGVKEEEFELVVLSVGLNPPKDARELSAKFGIELNAHGFCKTNPLNPIETSRAGIFVSGAFQGPTDIPESVVTASGADAQRFSGAVRQHTKDSRPPGLSALCRLAKAPMGSSKNITPKREVTRSNSAPAKGNWCTSAWRNSTLPRPRCSARSHAIFSGSAEMSRPITCPNSC